MKTKRPNNKSRSTTGTKKRGSSHGNGIRLPKEGRITVYGKTTCPWCQKMKQHIGPNDVFVKLTPRLMPAFKRHIAPHIRGQETIPVVFVGTTFIGGHDDYVKYVAKQ